MNTSHRILPSLALVASLATGAALLLDQRSTAGPAPAARDGAHELSRAFRDVARNISPSVVSVQATRELDNRRTGFRNLDPDQDPFGQLRRFFGEQDPSL